MYGTLKMICGLVVLSLIGCSSDSDSELPTVEEQQDHIREIGSYCCTVDGRATDDRACVLRPGAVYLEDFRHVSPSGQGEACGWIVNP